MARWPPDITRENTPLPWSEYTEEEEDEREEEEEEAAVAVAAAARVSSLGRIMLSLTVGYSLDREQSN
jgi:hypothetical protein